ncbi:MAG TPA: cbb3-type cytochrome c oxidase subunit 3 [Cyclobacteriaceae bacterium]|nr:cbb3-type cytochrome c oxidase subunit 3 [Cyclobacteriaceae bacterium]MCB9239424.1 cbb3-type cytochrome c oxidase subunit 3 [Flammeovirgaceae bacterium]MCB0499651.1 cbb3-type cytochrome c oxidase subunit 3 [Cyclobacteriaceae bacterium]MCO5271193.1 cbb3-type cytochrome c oxidase subunit 3 [Cyclobacteriaceae bacterium]MCW5902601.1 cbb3-type cytochrome c oxidase subunit 3 [Cyclobacteriaceae bacterium]
MYKDILRDIDNIGIWPTISFVIFFLFFLILIWWVLKADKTFMAKMGNKPFEDGIDMDRKGAFKQNEL